MAGGGGGAGGSVPGSGPGFGQDNDAQDESSEEDTMRRDDGDRAMPVAPDQEATRQRDLREAQERTPSMALLAQVSPLCMNGPGPGRPLVISLALIKPLSVPWPTSVPSRMGTSPWSQSFQSPLSSPLLPLPWVGDAVGISVRHGGQPRNDAGA